MATKWLPKVATISEVHCIVILLYICNNNIIFGEVDPLLCPPGPGGLVANSWSYRALGSILVLVVHYEL